jgi:hypothetical protein
MLRPVFLLLLLAVITLAHAQESNSSQQDTTHNKGKIIKTKLDSVDQKVNGKIDGVQSKINAMLHPDLRTIVSKLKSKKDSVTSDSIAQVRHNVDSLKNNLTHKVDSLKGLHLPTDKFDHLTDSLKNAGPYKHIAETESKINALEQKINQPVDKAEGAINEKLSLMNKAGGSGANLPGKVDLPGVDANTKLNLDQNKLNVNGLKTDNPLSKIDNPIKDQLGGVNELKGKVNDLKSIPQEQISKVTSIDEVQKAKEGLGKVNEITDKAQSYKSDVKSIAEGKVGDVKELPKTLENQVGKISEVKDFQKQTGALGQYASLTDQDKAKQLLQQQMKDQVLTEAKNHFAGKEQVLQQAMDKLSKLKTKYVELKFLNDSLKLKPNSLKKTPFIERIIPGITLQIQKGTLWEIDYNPWIAYQLNKRYSVGAGWNERFGISKKWDVTTTNRIYGPRVFFDLKIKKGFSVRTEIEKMNSLISSPTTITSVDASGRAWVWSWFVGVKKQYTFIKTVKGNFQFLYNLYDDHYSSPYSQRYNVRFGFEFPMKKRLVAKKDE